MRVPVGGYLKGSAVYHCKAASTLRTRRFENCLSGQSSTRTDLRTSILLRRPGLFLEHEHLLACQVYNKSHIRRRILIPFGKAIVREGTDVTTDILRALQRSLKWRSVLEKTGISVELFALARAIRLGSGHQLQRRKPQRGVVVAHEDPISRLRREIAALNADELFEYPSDAPVKRVGATDTFLSLMRRRFYIPAAD